MLINSIFIKSASAYVLKLHPKWKINCEFYFEICRRDFTSCVIEAHNNNGLKWTLYDNELLMSSPHIYFGTNDRIQFDTFFSL